MEKREHSPNIAADPDLEENGDADAGPSDLEPSLGSNDNFANQEHWAKGNIVANDRDVGAVTSAVTGAKSARGGSLVEEGPLDVALDVAPGVSIVRSPYTQGCRSMDGPRNERDGRRVLRAGPSPYADLWREQR